MNKETLYQLIEKHLDGLLSDVEFDELQDILKTDPEARKKFRRYLNLDAALYDEIEGGQLASENTLWQSMQQESTESKSSRKNFIQRLALPLAASLTVGILVWWIQPSATKPAEETMHQGYAILTRMIDAEWNSQDSDYREGQVLPPGNLNLKSGLAQVEFFGGATVILQGETNFEIISTSEARCLSGRVRAHVPPAARGFILRTPKGDIVDLGTDFAVDISNQDANVHVFEGEIEVHQDKQKTQFFKTGQGFDLASRTPSIDKPLPGSFVSVADLDSQSTAARQSLFEKWKTYSDDLSEDPRLIAYYTFDQPGSWSRVLKNVAASGHDLDGAIVGARRVTGRWPARKSALEFKPTGSRTRVFIPGEFKSLTFACWARIDSLDRQYNALFLADNYQAGEPHWQIQNDGKLMLSIMIRETGKNRNHIYFSPVIWDVTKSGQWMHIASVFDEKEQNVTHYINGQIVSKEKAPPEKEVHTTRIGAGEIGNWGLPMRPDDSWFAIRNLNGAIDEFAIFSSAIPEAEIKKMYDLGRPN